MPSLSAAEALARLRDGNRRFVAGDAPVAATDEERRAALTDGQEPFAVVLGCADSRVPAELVFDQGLGDLFVVRVAGNIAAPSQIGSAEFAVRQLGTRLVVVLGHTGCGAVTATLDLLRGPGADLSPNLRVIAEHIRPAVAPLLAGDPAAGTADLLDRAVRANVRNAVHHLLQGSPLLAGDVQDGDVQVVGAVYDLASGEVVFLDDDEASP